MRKFAEAVAPSGGMAFPGPQAIKFTGETGNVYFIEGIKVTPAMAERFLKTNHDRQRTLNASAMDKLLRSVTKADMFMFTGDTIKFDVYGYLCDGQHRLNTIVRTRRAMETLVIHGITEDAFPFLGENVKWSGAQYLKAENPEINGNWKTISAILQILYRWDGQTVAGGYSNTATKMSNIELAEMFEEHRSTVAAAQVGGKLNYRIGTPPSIMGAAYFRLRQVDSEYADEFFTALLSGIGLDPGLALLRDRLIKEVETTSQPGVSAKIRWRMIAFTIKVWNARKQGNVLKVLKWDWDNHPFPIAIR